MKKKKLLSVVLAVLVCLAMMPITAFADEAANIDSALLTTTSAPADIISAPKSNDIVILSTSDVHCGVEENIGYAGLAAYKKKMEAENKYVTLVDAGDAIQGKSIGLLSEGEALVDIMNKIGYDLAVPGNHEFDYGMDQFLNVIVKNQNAQYISCNFNNIEKDELVFEPYVIKKYGKKKVAFIGISTPETLIKSSPKNFIDDAGNYIYDFYNDTTGNALYKQVQKTINAAKKEGADYIIAVGHLGLEADTLYYKSSDVIKNTTGIDVFVDGHDHRDGEVTSVKDKNGKTVKLMGSSIELGSVGKIVISENGKITVTTLDATVLKDKDAEVDAFVKDIVSKNDELLNQVVAKTSVDLISYDANGNRLIRKEETNLGNLCSDAYRIMSGADIGIINGGGIRAELKKGNITNNDIISVFPYGNTLCVCKATGQEILDALELGMRAVGEGESGGFLHTSGLTFSVNPYIASSVVLDEKSNFVEVAGARKVSDVKVNGEPIDKAKTYTIACHGYKLKEGGDGFNMFMDNEYIQDGTIVDNEMLITYIKENLNGNIGSEYAKPQGRMTILSGEAALESAKEELERVSLMKEVAEYEPVLTVKSGKTVNVSWNECNASGVKYAVYASTKKNSGFKKLTTTEKTSVKYAKSLDKNKTYYFKVRAIKSFDNATYYGEFSTKKTGKKTA